MKYAIVHIADIHYRKNEPEGASAVINTFIKDLILQKKSLPEHQLYLCITGDIIYEGKDSASYTAFHKEFDQKLNEIGITKDYRIIVPGNHDIDQTIVQQDLTVYQNKIYNNIEAEQTFNNFIDKENQTDNKFDNYALFESDFAKYGIDYSLPGKGWIIDSNLGVFCLNTALCSFGGVNKIVDKDRLAIYTRGIINWSNNASTPIKILLMHHPITHLNKWSRDEIKQIIENNFSLCLCGHDHEQDIFYNKISQKSLICLTPQLYTTKHDDLGYAIILIEENVVSKLIYRQYMKGKFLPGQKFSENAEGIVNIQSVYLKSIEVLEAELKNALAFFKGQPDVFIEPKLSKNRGFDREENLLGQLIINPQPSFIVAHPQFGLTCLSHYMRLEAFKRGSFWVYLDANHIKARNVNREIENQLHNFEKRPDDIKCIIIDSWNSSIVDHVTILKSIDNDYKKTPIIVMSNYTELNYNINFDLSKLNTSFNILHLQALQRDKVRDIVSQYNKKNKIENEDVIVAKVVKDLEVLNVHRTPLNCLTLLKVFEKDFNEDLINRTKMIKALLFILFTDADSFRYSSNKPDVEDCEYVLGKFCKNLIKTGNRWFTRLDFQENLMKYCKEKLISLDIDTILNILETNNIIIPCNGELEFKHSYWIFYFASNYMLHEEEFKQYILQNRNYVNFPEIIEFYTGLDGRRDDAINVLLDDLKHLSKQVDDKIGIPEHFNPFKGIVWNPSEAIIETIRKDILEKVKQSKLPTIIKDQHADEGYNSEAPYDQSIKKFLNEYSVISLMQAIKASSRGLRNSNYIEPELKKEFFQSILNCWEQVSRVFILLSPTLAKEGKATYEGLGLILLGDFGDSYSEKLKNIYIANPWNVVTMFKDDLASKKIGPLICENLSRNKSEFQKHLLSLFLVQERPLEWYNELFNFMNLLHRNSFILGGLFDALNKEIKEGFISTTDELIKLKELMKIVIAKHKYGPKDKVKEIPMNMTINEANKLPIDKIIASGSDKKPFKSR
jgi:predicted MPP superfamily phosphohydrolase